MMMVIHEDIKMDIIGLRNLQKAVKSLDGWDYFDRFETLFDETISDDDNTDNDNEINYFNSLIALTKKTFSEN